MSSNQIANRVFMLRPSCFGFNTETASTNAFQLKEKKYTPVEIQQKAQEEFDACTQHMSALGIHVDILQDSTCDIKPDAIFLNNWFSLHANGLMVLYPLMATNRRLERKKDLIKIIQQKGQVKDILDLSIYEERGKYLESTGSMVFDHIYKKIYANLSIRTDLSLIDIVAKKIEYEPIVFHATDENNKDIYHTNVMMHIGESYSVVALETIRNEKERQYIRQSLLDSKREIIDISMQQVRHFAGNMLGFKSSTQIKPCVILSKDAYNILTPIQKQILEKWVTLYPQSLYTIEQIGGGSARCMIAENFLPLL